MVWGHVKKIIFRLSLSLLVVLLITSAVPYFFDVSDYRQSEEVSPFNNGHFSEINGVRLHYQYQKTNTNSLGNVLLIHGLGGSTFSWRFTLTDLAEEGYSVVAVDLPGFGFSDRKTGLNHSQKERSLLLWNFLDALEADYPELSGRPWSLAGHSMGGGTVVAMTLAQPERTSQAVLVAGAVFQNNPRSGTWLLRYPPLARGVSVVLERYFITEGRLEPVLASAYGRSVTQEELDGYLIPLQQPGTSRFLIDLLRTAENEPFEALLDTGVDLYGIWGEKDTWVPLSQGQRISNLFPDFTLAVIPEAAHCPMETHPDEFLSYFTEMVRQ